MTSNNKKELGMSKIGIFYGSTTGNTAAAAKQIQAQHLVNRLGNEISLWALFEV
jgi:hypothetical protein